MSPAHNYNDLTDSHEQRLQTLENVTSQTKQEVSAHRAKFHVFSSYTENALHHLTEQMDNLVDRFNLFTQKTMKLEEAHLAQQKKNTLIQKTLLTLLVGGCSVVIDRIITMWLHH